MIGDFRTDALHQALRESRIEDSTLLGLLVLALAGKNVSVHSGATWAPSTARGSPRRSPKAACSPPTSS